MLVTFERRHVWKRVDVAFANQIFTPWPLKPGNSFRWMISEPIFNMTLSVLFIIAFNVLTNVVACHLPLYQYVAIAFRILVLSVNFIVSPVLQCYLAHWLSCQSHSFMVRPQRGIMFHIAWNIWGNFVKETCNIAWPCRKLTLLAQLRQ